jgi:hypothetical protein
MPQKDVWILQYAFTGPWKVTAALKGALYELEHCSTPSQKEKKHASNLSSYPTELIPFKPVDGPDTWYGQLYKPIAAHPFKEAGIKGFTPMSPFKITSHLLTTDHNSAFHWPSLSELNNKIVPFPWSSEEERRKFLTGDSILTLLVMYTGPPLAAPTYPCPANPPLNTLTRSIIQSSDKLFFIFKSIGQNDACKWRLVCVAFQESMSAYPSCLQDGHFLLDFSICHPSNSQVNAINQRYWLQYHTLSKLLNPLSSTDTHLIRPYDTLEDYVTRHKLCPFRKWLNLTHIDTFIHGPFEFAAAQGCKTQDRISQADWDILKMHLDMFHKSLPQFDVPSYSVHVDRGAPISFHDTAISCQLVLTTSHIGSTLGTPTSP